MQKRRKKDHTNSLPQVDESYLNDKKQWRQRIGGFVVAEGIRCRIEVKGYVLVNSGEAVCGAIEGTEWVKSQLNILFKAIPTSGIG